MSLFYPCLPPTIGDRTDHAADLLLAVPGLALSVAVPPLSLNLFVRIMYVPDCPDGFVARVAFSDLDPPSS